MQTNGRTSPRKRAHKSATSSAVSIERQLPHRMPLGTMFLGPEYYGCVGTGLRPTILHSRNLQKHATLARGYRFAIGTELFVNNAVTQMLHGKVPPGQTFVEYDERRFRVTFTKTYAIAKKRFLFLCKEVMDDNAKQQQRHRRLLKGAAKGDLKSILGLSDF